MKCQKCTWTGSVEDCDVWQDEQICPECGSPVEETVTMLMIDEDDWPDIPVMRPITTAVRLPKEVTI